MKRGRRALAKRKTRVIVFTANNARILTNPENVEAFRDMPNAFVDPDLSEVVGLPPHFWKVVDGKIVSMTRPEKVARLRDIGLKGADNTVATRPLPRVRAARPWLWPVLSFITGVALTLALKGWG
jgi:hypothetical protein